MMRPSIKAEWRKLLLINYEVDSHLLDPYLPSMTEYALWQGKCYVSLVGFLFLETQIGGVKIPLHTNFPEVNLRFYVRRKAGKEWHYGVVFIREIVSLPIVKFIANNFFYEHYEVLPLEFIIANEKEELKVEYRWKKNWWNSISIRCDESRIPILKGSQEEFFTAQHWGYSKASEQKTIEYSVQHPEWEMYRTHDYHINVDFQNMYGDAFAFLNTLKPDSVFLAEGSEIILEKHKVIKLD